MSIKLLPIAVAYCTVQVLKCDMTEGLRAGFVLLVAVQATHFPCRAPST